jgi:hypothetical protein
VYPLDPEFVVCCDSDDSTFRFPEIGVGEERVLTFDFSSDLLPGEGLIDTPVVSVSTTAGDDGTPTDVLNGAAEYNAVVAPATPTQVQQPVSGANAQPGFDYFFSVTAQTSNPQKVLGRYAILPIRG